MNGQMAVCRRDRAPLIPTFAFSGYEFYCLECGARYGWLSPDGVDPTPEIDARYARLLAEWKEIGGEKLIGGGVMLKSCETCTSTHEPHWSHATDAEKAVHEQALEALRARAAS